MTTTGNPCVTPNVCYEPTCCNPCGFAGRGFGSGLAFILVLFILLAIVGACWF